MKKKALNGDYIKTFREEKYEFEVKLEIAYVIGKDRLDDDLKRFVDEETYCDGITIFSILVMYLYEKYLGSGFCDIYEFLTYEYEKYYELFKKECFVEVE